MRKVLIALCAFAFIFGTTSCDNPQPFDANITSETEFTDAVTALGQATSGTVEWRLANGEYSNADAISVPAGVTLNITGASKDGAKIAGSFVVGSGSTLSVSSATLSKTEDGGSLISSTAGSATIKVDNSVLSLTGTYGNAISVNAPASTSNAEATIHVTNSEIVLATSGTGYNNVGRAIDVNSVFNSSLGGKFASLDLDVNGVKISNDGTGSTIGIAVHNVTKVEADITNLTVTPSESTPTQYGIFFNECGDTAGKSTIAITKSDITSWGALLLRRDNNVEVTVDGSTLNGVNAQAGTDADIYNVDGNAFSTIQMNDATKCVINVKNSTVTFGVKDGCCHNDIFGIQAFNDSYTGGGNAVNFTNCDFDLAGEGYKVGDQIAVIHSPNAGTANTYSFDDQSKANLFALQANSNNIKETDGAARLSVFSTKILSLEETN